MKALSAGLLGFGVGFVVSELLRAKGAHPNSKQQHETGRSSRPTSCCEAVEDTDWSGADYKRWRPPEPLTFGDAYAQVFQESQRCARSGNYGRPASRRAVLGRMAENKRTQWLACRAGCPGVDPSDFGYYGQLMSEISQSGDPGC